ncbi:glycosyltransferase family 10 [Agrobacterium sp. CNPSo 3708]|uniref:glycosyltransferase family 10 domain-containing protein n=1 Tax=unclassified Agrobacterium TaxID=2632611 RepID=UPI002363784F|nr:glycosyltransferase family 10 [Agrobacterium sp. CNPSo 3708]MDD1498520.1 glycosyltransferase family 10 [Agrobacterium sp. CNPSo 3708]
MPKVGLISSCTPEFWLRYFPDRSPYWNGIEFELSGDVNDCDLIVAFNEIPEDQSGKIKATTSIFLASEPPSIKTYNERFLSQFDVVYGVDQSSRHKNLIVGHVPTLWHIGLWDEQGVPLKKMWDYSDFEQFQPTKKKSISIITSNKAYTTGHRQRIEFAEKIKNYFGDEVDLFGRGRNNFGDKLQVIPEYRYHIAIENSSYFDYWTEKLSDTYLSMTLPIYCGCPNIGEYFSDKQIITINPRDLEGSLKSIKTALESDRAEISVDAIRAARTKVLSEYNVINLISKICNNVTLTKYAKSKTLFSEVSFERRYSQVRNGAKALWHAAKLHRSRSNS